MKEFPMIAKTGRCTNGVKVAAGCSREREEYGRDEQCNCILIIFMVFGRHLMARKILQEYASRRLLGRGFISINLNVD